MTGKDTVGEKDRIEAYKSRKSGKANAWEEKSKECLFIVPRNQVGGK